jgi:hypothetical protein
MSSITPACRLCGSAFKGDVPDPPVCEKCRTIARKKKRQKKKRNASNRLKKIERGGVQVLMDAVAFGGTNIPHSSELLERLMMYFGGVNGFASLCVKQYYDSPPGGSARNRLLETIIRLTSKNTDQGGAKRPLTLWTEDELESELDNRFKMAVEQYQGRIINADTPQEAPGLPSPTHPAFYPDDLPVSEGGVEEFTRRVSEQAAREFEALPPDSAAGGVPQEPGE